MAYLIIITKTGDSIYYYFFPIFRSCEAKITASFNISFCKNGEKT